MTNNPVELQDAIERTPYCPNCGEACLDPWHSPATAALSVSGDMREALECPHCAKLGAAMAKFITGGVHFAVEPEHSSVDYQFRKRDEAGEFHRLLCDIHPLDENGCFVNALSPQQKEAP